MLNSVHVRPARPEDKAAVLAFCQNTFSWGDYIANVWDDWVKQEHGGLFVALVDGQPVGIVHAALLDHAAAWMEGMRVHPAFRRQGIATALDERACAFARDHHCQVARLVTSVKNTAAQSHLNISKYHPAARFNDWESNPQVGEFDFWRVATEDAASTILARWIQSPLYTASHGVLPNRHWRWIALDEQRLHQQIHAGEVRVIPNGFALLPAFDEDDWNGLSIHGLVGDADQAHRIALAARAEAAYRGYAHVEAILADYAPINAAMERAGFKSEGGMLLYEQTL